MRTADYKIYNTYHTREEMHRGEEPRHRSAVRAHGVFVLPLRASVPTHRISVRPPQPSVRPHRWPGNGENLSISLKTHFFINN